MTAPVLVALTALFAGSAGAAVGAAPGSHRDGPQRLPASSSPPMTAFEMPFPCGQAWTGATRSTHSPSPNSIDWNRPDDAGDPVVASAPGTVVRAELTSSGYGHWVMLEHATGERTIYAHLDAVDVALGQAVDQGARVGTVGETGNAQGEHLHFEERTSGGSVLAPWFHGTPFTFGTTLVSQNCPDVPLAGNFVAGPEAELVVFRRTAKATFQVNRPGSTPKVMTFGKALDQPVVGDWDGNGLANPGVKVAGKALFRLRAPGGVVKLAFGAAGDLPVAGDWDGDGRWEIGVRQAGTSTFLLRGADGTTTTATLGDADDLPVTGDWDGDGRTDLGVYDQATATFTLRVVDADGLSWTAQVPFGQPGDLPVAGDWDGNLVTEVGVWNPDSATFLERRSTGAVSARSSTRTTVFGNPR